MKRCEKCLLNIALLSDMNAQHKALRAKLRTVQDQLFGELIVNEFQRRELEKKRPGLTHRAKRLRAARFGR